MSEIVYRFDVPVRTGHDGGTGWTPQLAVVADGVREVLQVSGWTGGTGDEPESGVYVGAAGFVSDIADAVSIKGSDGVDGVDGDDGGSGSSVAVIPWTAAAGEAWSLAATAGAVEPYNVGSQPVYISDFVPTDFRLTYNQTGEALGCTLGFQYSTDGSTWLDGQFISMGATLGVRTLTGTLTIVGAGPVYFRPAFTHDEDVSLSASVNAGILFYHLVISAAGTGGGGGGGSSTPTTYTLATLKALATHANGDGAMVRFGVTSGDGVAGPRYYDSASTATPDDNDVIQPNDVSGAGRWLRILT